MRLLQRATLSLLGVALLTASQLIGAQTQGDAPWSAAGGKTDWRLNGAILRDLNINATAHGALRRGEDAAVFAMRELGSLEFESVGGEFKRLKAGALPHQGGWVFRFDNGTVDLRNFRIQRHPKIDNAFVVVDSQGQDWLTLQYGHFDYQPQASVLTVRFMDLRLTEAFARVLGDVRLTGEHLGTVDLNTEVVVPDHLRLAKGSCSAATARWPTDPMFSANVEMLAMDFVNQTARLGGRVAITPSASFHNIGTADIPWFAMFSTPSNEVSCIDDGSGNCMPYGNDQGGKLVWAFYRIYQGRIEQLGRSHVKHAFNSINANCACAQSRVVYSGCADIYSISTNADRGYLAPRTELEAHDVIWNHAGSIFDSNGDDHCDAGGGYFFGEAPCNVGFADALDRRMSVLETELALPGARYFMESWYLVRDDVNIFNSMARRELTPTLVDLGNDNDLWTFPFAGAFELGPAVDLWVEPATAVPGESSALLSTLEGDVRLVARSEDLGNGRWRYRYAVMNFDFDRQVSALSIPLPLGARVSNVLYFDGDQDGANNWAATIDASSIRWDAPVSTGLDWGVLASFEFDAALPPVNGSATVFAMEAGAPASFNLSAVNLLDDVLFFDGFED